MIKQLWQEMRCLKPSRLQEVMIPRKLLQQREVLRQRVEARHVVQEIPRSNHRMEICLQALLRIREIEIHWRSLVEQELLWGDTIKNLLLMKVSTRMRESLIGNGPDNWENRLYLLNF